MITSLLDITLGELESLPNGNQECSKNVALARPCMFTREMVRLAYIYLVSKDILVLTKPYSKQDFFDFATNNGWKP
jgi:hypothetical protein